MCQAYEAEASAIRSSEAFARARKMEMDGRMARQAGEPRSRWEGLVYGVDHARPDDAGTMHTPSWWMAHWFDGPLIKAWLSGYDDEGERIAAGGMPMTPDERKGLSKEIQWLHHMDHELGLEGLRVRLPGRDVSRLLRLKGATDHADYAAGLWEMVTEDARSFVRDGLAKLEGVLDPHRVAMRRTLADA